VADTREQDDERRWAESMRLAHRGDAEAYGRLLEEIAVVMERYLRRRFGESDFVEDCVQESLLAIHRARDSDPRRSFRAWMFAILRHKAIDLLRRRGTRERHEAPAEAGAGVAHAADPEAGLQAAELLGELSPEHGEALLLTKLHGHTLAEAAQLAGVSPTAMKSRVHRGLKQLRVLLEREALP
jgi:RNA polymerase sigma-70 factor (ECF subfamily)